MKARLARKVIVLYVAKRVGYRPSTIARCTRRLRAIAKSEGKLTDPALTTIPSLPHVDEVLYFRRSQKNTAQWYTSRPSGLAGVAQRSLFREHAMPSWSRPLRPTPSPLVPWPGRHHQELPPPVPDLVMGLDAYQVFGLCSPEQQAAIQTGLDGERAIYATRVTQELRTSQRAVTDSNLTDEQRQRIEQIRAAFQEEERQS